MMTLEGGAGQPLVHFVTMLGGGTGGVLFVKMLEGRGGQPLVHFGTMLEVVLEGWAAQPLVHFGTVLEVLIGGREQMLWWKSL